jgi:hypothetical protein
MALKKAIGISNTNLISTSNTNWYFKYQLVLQIPIGTSNTNWYFKYQLVLQIPYVTIHQEQEQEQQQQQQQQQSGYKSRASTTCSWLKTINWA